jgi:hypothetical protein
MMTSPAVPPAAIEARTIHKLRMRIIPFVFVLYVIAFLDRINIGFAALTMNKELAIPASSSDSSREFSSLATSFLKYPATCCCTKSEHVSGLRE